MDQRSFGGIDPGKDGSLAVIRPDDTVEFFDVPMAVVEMTTKTKLGNKKQKRVYLPHSMAKLLREAGIHLVTIERAAPMPSFKGGKMIPQGAVSAFASGEGFGMWQGLLAALDIPFQIVAAATWKAALMKDLPKTKEAAVPFASRLYPRAAKDLTGPKGGLLVDRADALLLAHFGRSKAILASRGMAL